MSEYKKDIISWRWLQMIKLKLLHCKIILRHWHLSILLYNLPHGLKALVWYYMSSVHY